MSERAGWYERQCNVCYHIQEVDPFDDFACRQCGQKYERAAYAEGHRIVLSPEQCRLLREGPPRCKTCGWWERESPTDGDCGNVVKIGEPMDSDGGPDSLTYSYDEGGGFMVGQDFGCVHHKEKE